MWHEVHVIGNLGRDPELRFTPAGQTVCNFSVAVDDSHKDKDGEKHERTIWLRISTWGKLAEVCNAHLAKGSKVLIVGKLIGDDKGSPRIWESNGESKASFEINANTVRFLSPSTQKEAKAETAVEDDIPF